MVHNYYQLSGGEDTVVSNEKKMLEDNGHEVVLYTRHNAEIKSMKLFKKVMLPFMSIFNLKTYLDIKRIIVNEKIDIVHIHNTLHLISPAVYYAAVKCGVPVVQTVHNFRFLCPGAMLYRDGHICEDCISKGLVCALKNKCYRNSAIQTFICTFNMWLHRQLGILGKIYFICLTEFNRTKLLQLNQIRENRVFVKPNYVDGTDNIIIGSQRKNQFIFAGRLDKLKGIDLLCHAWKEMGYKAPKLIVCGTGPMEEWCREYVKDNNLNIELKGFLSNQEVKKIIANSKALILPTRLYEGFPMTIVEAYSVGTPVICSDLGNCRCIVEEGVTGWKINNSTDLVEKIEQYSDLVMSTYKHYKEQYNMMKNYEILRDIYHNICDISNNKYI